MNICIFGASITWGAYDEEAAGWANRLRMHFESKNDDVCVYNLGICGDTSRDLLKRIEIEAEARKPEIIIFGIGTNDSRFLHKENRQETSPDEYRQNLLKLAEIAKKFVNNIIFIGLTPVDEARTDPWKKNKSYLNSRIDELNQVIKNVCKENDFKYISMEGVVEESELYDGLHPNAIGHRKIFQKIVKEIEIDV